jgi:hypothetical protein
MPQMTKVPHVKYLTFLSDFNEMNNLQIYNIMTIRPMGAELLHVEGQTDIQTHMTRLIVVFCKFVNALKSAPPEGTERHNLA